VTAIVGINQYRLVFTGIQNHAGTTPMPIRKDAGVAMMRLYNDIMAKFPAVAGPRSVWTVGRLAVEPGAPAIIPGRAEMILQFRDADPAILQAFESTLLEIVAAHAATGSCMVECVKLSHAVPAPMQERLQEVLEQAAERHAPGVTMRLPSGAGHDAQILAQRLPAAMMFVPSIGGISHHFTENTADDDIVLGCQVFADAVAAILGRN
jgi:N-carbamoyl-L-amino-acid hydrolase